MASLQTTSIFSSSSFSSSLRKVNASIHVPNPPRVTYSVPKAPTRKLQVEELINGSVDSTPLEKNAFTTHIYEGLFSPSKKSNMATVQLYSILEAVADRIEMHKNICEQRNNWNTLLLNSINMITLTATAMAGVAAATSGDTTPLLALKLSSALLFSAATGMSLITNQIQPSQLTEEQRNATRLFKQLHIKSVKQQKTKKNPN